MAWYKRDSNIWSYLAGFIDSDGAVCITRCKRYGDRSGQVFLQPVIQFSNTDERVFEYFKEVLKEYEFSYIRQGMGNIWKDRFQARIQRRGWVKEILTNVLPFLVIKEEQAKKTLSFIESRDSREYNTGYSEDEWLLFEEVRELNRKGKM